MNINSLKKIIIQLKNLTWIFQSLQGKRLDYSFFSSLSWKFDSIRISSTNAKKNFVTCTKVILLELTGHILNGKYVGLQKNCGKY